MSEGKEQKVADMTTSDTVGSKDVTIELRPLGNSGQDGSAADSKVAGPGKSRSGASPKTAAARGSSLGKKKSQAAAAKDGDGGDSDDDSDDDDDDDSDDDDYDDMELPKNRHRRRGHVGTALDDDLALPTVKSWQWNPNGPIGQAWTVAAFVFLMYNVVGIPLRVCVAPEEPDWIVCTIVDVSSVESGRGTESALGLHCLSRTKTTTRPRQGLATHTHRPICSFQAFTDIFFIADIVVHLFLMAGAKRHHRYENQKLKFGPNKEEGLFTYNFEMHGHAMGSAQDNDRELYMSTFMFYVDAVTVRLYLGC